MESPEKSAPHFVHNTVVHSFSGSVGLESPTTVYFDAGSTIYSAGRKFNGVYLIQKGVAKAYISVEDTEVLATIASFGNVLGIDSLHSENYISNAVTATNVIALWFPPELFFTHLRTSDAFRSWISDVISAALAETTNMIRALPKSSAVQKVAFLLLKIYFSSAVSSDRRYTFNIELSRAEMAAYLCLSVETISRKLTLLSQLGYIKLRGRHIRIRDIEGLREMCRAFLV